MTTVERGPAGACGAGAALPRPDWLALWLQAGAPVQFWDERWERLTGLSAADLGGAPCEAVLDWLFPLQRDRECVDDWLYAPGRPGGQAVLEVLTPAGSRPMLCTLLPVTSAPAAGPHCEGWLLLAGEPEGQPLELGSGTTAAAPESMRAHPAEAPSGPHARPERSRAQEPE
jgi:hypothetical protein